MTRGRRQLMGGSVVALGLSTLGGCNEILGNHPPDSSSLGGEGGEDPGSGGKTAGGGRASGGGPTSGGATSNSGGAAGETGTGGALVGGAPSVGGAAPSGGAVSVGGGAPAGGNDGSGGGGMNGGHPIPKPQLITSAAGAFWKTDVEPTLGGTTATMTVDTATEYQDWIGWGSTFNEVGWRELMKLNQTERDRVMKLLFSRVDGLALTWAQIPIGASDHAIERYTLCDAPCNANNIESSFSIEHDKDPGHGLIPYIKAAQAVVAAEKAQYEGVPDTKFWGTPWTPPPWMKSNGAYDKGVMKNDTVTRKAYAKYFRLWVESYEAEGIPIDHVAAQTEPGWAMDYPSCAWGPFEGGTGNTSTEAFLGNFIAEDLVPELGDRSDVWFGTFANNAHFPAYWGSLVDKSKVKGTGLQWEAVASIATPVNAGQSVMQSAHRCGNYPWLSQTCSGEDCDANSFWAARAPNNYNYAIESWGLFKQWITSGTNGYSASNMVLDRIGRNLDTIRPWPQNALISFHQDGSVNVTPYYYVFRHLSQYVLPGGKRIGVTGGDALAFKNPDGSIVVAMYNSGAAAQTTLSIDGTMMQFTVPQKGWATVNYTP